MAIRRTSTGFNEGVLSYDTGSGFTDIAEIILIGETEDPTLVSANFPSGTNYEARSWDLSSVAGLEDQSNVTFRLTFTGASAAGGNVRIDNLLVTGVESGASPNLVNAYSVDPTIVRAVLGFEPASIDAADFDLTDSQGSATIIGISTVDPTTYDLTLSDALTDTLVDTLTYTPSSTSADFIGGITDLADFRDDTIAEGETITVNVTITAIGGSNVAAQQTGAVDPAGRGILFFSSSFAGDVDVDDEVLLAATTSSFTQSGSNRKQLNNPIIISQFPGVPIAPTVVPAADFQADNTPGQNPAEQWEGVLITVENLTNADDSPGFGQWIFDEGVMARGSEFFTIGTNIEAGKDYNLTGIGWEAFGDYTVNVRSADDIEEIVTSVQDWMLID